MIIKRAKTQGFCFGVAITVKKAEEAVARPGVDVTTLGHVVHNPQMVASLEPRASRTRIRSRKSTRGDAVRARARLADDVFERAKGKNLTVIDATCPMVTKIHVQAEKLKAEGYKIVVVGDRGPSRSEGHALARPRRLVIVTRRRRCQTPAREPRRRRRAIDVERHAVYRHRATRSARNIMKSVRSTRSAPTRTIVSPKPPSLRKTSK